MNFEQVSKQNLEKIKSRRYEIEAGKLVTLSWEEFTPESNDGQVEAEKSSKASIFLPGWGVESGFKTAQVFSQALATESSGKSFSINTKLENTDNDDPINTQAQAIRQFIKEQGITELTLFGHSMGGDKAIDLTTMLQTDSELKINGLVLMDSTGLYEQDKNKFAKNFVTDATIATPKTVIEQLWQANYSKKQRLDMLKRGVRTLVDVMTGVIRDVLKYKADYPTKLNKEVSDMVNVNSNLAEIRVPVIIMSGDKDPISDPTKIVPPAEEERIVQEMEKDLDSSKFVDPREKYLQENLLPNSPYVRMIIGKKMGHHILPYFRPESVAKVGLYVLERYYRNLK